MAVLARVCSIYHGPNGPSSLDGTRIPAGETYFGSIGGPSSKTVGKIQENNNGEGQRRAEESEEESLIPNTNMEENLEVGILPRGPLLK